MVQATQEAQRLDRERVYRGQTMSSTVTAFWARQAELPRTPQSVYPCRIIRLHSLCLFPPQGSVHGDNTAEGIKPNMGGDPNLKWYLQEPLSLQQAPEVPEAQVSPEFQWDQQHQLVLSPLENPKVQ